LVNDLPGQSLFKSNTAFAHHAQAPSIKSPVDQGESPEGGSYAGSRGRAIGDFYRHGQKACQGIQGNPEKISECEKQFGVCIAEASTEQALE